MCIVWGNARETELNHIVILQKRTVRLIPDNQIMSNTPGILQSSDPLFLKLNILKIKDIYLVQILHLFNCVNSNIITNFKNSFKLNCHVHDYITRFIQMLIHYLIICTSSVIEQAFID